MNKILKIFWQEGGWAIIKDDYQDIEEIRQKNGSKRFKIYWATFICGSRRGTLDSGKKFVFFDIYKIKKTNLKKELKKEFASFL